MSESKLGPRVIGVFSGGRIEEFIQNAHTCTREEMRDPKISAEIAIAMRRVNENVDCTCDDDVWGRMEKWYKVYEECGVEVSEDLWGEIQWCKEYLKRIDSPAVFAHGDVIFEILLIFILGPEWKYHG